MTLGDLSDFRATVKLPSARCQIGQCRSTSSRRGWIRLTLSSRFTSAGMYSGKTRYKPQSTPRAITLTANDLDFQCQRCQRRQILSSWAHQTRHNNTVKENRHHGARCKRAHQRNIPERRIPMHACRREVLRVALGTGVFQSGPLSLSHPATSCHRAGLCRDHTDALSHCIMCCQSLSWRSNGAKTTSPCNPRAGVFTIMIV